MLLFALCLTMVSALVTATAIATHNEAQRIRVRATAKRNRIFR
ncbi:hypothetical protein [Aureimonas sp. AU4]|nr:hypothetical protein [Aureimonas sp. AU4]BAT30677.1 hypothetical protein [Aureimonas sp. AU4]